jgi:hypothetical protein
LKRCYHDKRIHACRTETDECVTGFIIVCAACGMMRRSSMQWCGLWLDWEKIRTTMACIKSFPLGARFTVLWSGASDKEATAVCDAAIEALRVAPV